MRKLKLIIFGWFLIIILLFIFIIFRNNIKFYLIGDKEINMEYNTLYQDKGAIAKVFKFNLNKKIKTSSNLNPKKIGVYNYNYSLSFLGKKYKLKRKINVIDKKAPILTLNGNEVVNIYVDEKFNDLKATAYDDYDKDITKNIKISSNVNYSKPGEYEIIYSVKDSSGNESSISRKIRVLKKIENKNSIENKELVQKESKTNLTDKDKKVINYIKEKNYDVSIGYLNLITGDDFYYQENKIYYGASLIKTLDAMYLYEKNMVNDEIKEYIKKAISVSDNNAHNYLINYIGKNNLKKYGQDLGALNTLTTSGYYGNTTVKDQMIYLKKLYSMTLTNEELKSFFINDYGNYIKINNLVTMHKYGYLGDVYHDVGIIFDEEPYIIIILSNHGNDYTYSVINDLSKLMYDYHKSN